MGRHRGNGRSIMKLYELPRFSHFTLNEEPRVPPDGNDPGHTAAVYYFNHVDGMYSYCTRESTVFHFAAWTEVTKVE